MRTRRNNKRRQASIIYSNNSNRIKNDVNLISAHNQSSMRYGKVQKREQNICINDELTIENNTTKSSETIHDNDVEIESSTCNLSKYNGIIDDSNLPVNNAISNQTNTSTINTTTDRNDKITLETVWNGITTLQLSISNISNSLDIVSTHLNSFDPRINELESNLDIIKKKTVNLENAQNDADGLKNELQVIKKELERFKSRKEEKNLSLSHIIIELREREIKSKNIFIYNVPEDNLWISQDYSTLDDINNFNNLVVSRDNSQARKILSNIPNINLDEIQTQRLGRMNTNNCRPLRVTLQSKEDVITIMKNKKLINNQYNIKTDLTKFQQQRIKELKEELEKNNSNSENPTLTIKFINGEPQLLQLRRNHMKFE